MGKRSYSAKLIVAVNPIHLRVISNNFSWSRARGKHKWNENQFFYIKTDEADRVQFRLFFFKTLIPSS